MKPLLFLDVDGPLNPYEARGVPNGYTEHTYRPDERRRPLRVLLNHSHGERLLKLPVDLVWATTWEHEANEYIGPHIGLPPLPVVEFEKGTVDGRSALHWKTIRLVEYADGRPFVWVDDEVTTHDRQYFDRHHSGRADTLLVSPSLGLTTGDFWTLNRKAQELSKHERSELG